MSISNLSIANPAKGTKKNIEKEVNLIQGVFGPSDARDHTLGILERGINHHWIRSFKTHEQMDKGGSYSDQKMAELTQSRDELIKLFRKAEENDLQISIKAEIKISLV